MLMVEKKNSIKTQKQQGFTKVRGNELSISFIYPQQHITHNLHNLSSPSSRTQDSQAHD